MQLTTSSTNADSEDFSKFSKPVVACDCDEVLARFVAGEPTTVCYLLDPHSLGVVQFHNEKYKTDLKFEDFFSYDFTAVWGGSREDAFEKLDR